MGASLDGTARLRAWLAEPKRTVRGLARAARVSPRTVRAWRDGTYVPSAESAARLAATTCGEVPVASWMASPILSPRRSRRRVTHGHRLLSEWLATTRITQSELARRLCVSRQRLGLWITTGTVPHDRLRPYIAEVTGGAVPADSWESVE